MPVVGEAIVRVRVTSSNLPNDIRNEINRAGPAADRDAYALGQRIGSRMDQGFRDRIQGRFANLIRADHNRSRAGLSNLFRGSGRGLGKEFADEFRLGIGAGRPGPAIISLLNLAGPSLIAAATNLFAAVGVAAAGALTAALSSTLLTGGLLFAAFASGAESLTAGIETFKEVGTAIGTAIADGMAGGFTQAANVVRDQILPALEGPLGAAGEALGGMFESLANTLSTPENLTRLGQILEINNGFIANFSTGLNGLTTAFLQLWVASKPMIDLIGSRFAEFGTWATNALAAADANGQLATVMDKLVQIASWLFDGLAKLGPAIGDWLTNLNVDKMIAGWESFWQLLMNVFSVFGAIADGAGPHFVTIMDNLSQIITNLVNSGVLQTAADRIATLLERFTAFIAEVTESELGAEFLAIGLAVLLFGGLLSPVVTILSALGSALSAVATAVGAALAPIALIIGLFAAFWTQSESFRQSIENLVTAVGGKFMEIWDELSPKIGPLVQAFLEWAGVMGDRLAPIIERLTPIIVGFIDIVGSVVSFIITQVTEFFGLLADLLSGDFAGAWEHAKALISNFFQFFQDIFTQIGQWFGTIWHQIWDETLKGPITGAISWVLERLNEFGTWIADSIRSFGLWIQQVWNDLWTKVGEIASTIWNGIIAFFQWVWNAIISGLSSAWATVTGILSGFWNAIVGLGQAIWSGFVSFLSFVWNAITSGVSSAWNTVTGILSGFWNAIVGLGQNVWNGFIGFLAFVWNAISSGVSSAWNAITGTLVGLWNSILSAAESIWNAVTGAIQSAVSSVSGWLSGIWNSIASTASSIWNSIVGIASSAWNAVYDAIVQPIIDAYNAVVGWIGSIRDAVAGVLDFLGSKVSEANDKLNTIIATQAEAGAVTANIFNPDAVGGTPAQLARGGIISATPGGINAVVGEGRNDERIEPLDSQGLSNRDRALISQIVNSMVGTFSTGGGSTIVKVQIGERELADFTSEIIADHEADLARRLHQWRRR